MKKGLWIGAALALAFAAPAWSVGRLADVTVFDRSDGKRLAVHWHEGRAYVVGAPGNEYQIVVRNRQRDDLLAVTSVDGINVVSGETANPQQSGYVISPWRALQIAGWRKSLERTAAFYFTPLPDSYAARSARPEHVGVIGIALFQRRRVEPAADISLHSRAPQSEAAPAAAGSGASDAARSESRAAEREQSLGTGHGRSESSPARQVEFERASSAPAETIVIYYDSYRNLIARGVLREPQPRPRLPLPFPAFVPDPPSG